MPHTKGPWLQRAEKFDDWGIIRSKETGWIVAKAEAGTHLTEEELNIHRANRTDPYEANARLIAAAPELLEALKKFLDLTSKERGWGTYPRMEGSQIYVDENEAREFANNVLAKLEAQP